MKAADWIVKFLSSKGVTDAFGLPGVVVLELLYAMDRASPEFTPHLTYHEQGASFAACGYAQVDDGVGVAYATRGPGLTNMITAVAEAYYDSIPVIFFTAHSSTSSQKKMRVENNQEIDSVALMMNITKYAARIDSFEELLRVLPYAYETAVCGRKGPVFLDILSSVLSKNLEDEPISTTAEQAEVFPDVSEEIAKQIRVAKRPVLLIGNGVHQAGVETGVREFAERTQIPVLSSRIAQDVMPDSSLYYGFIGSHATRYSNFVLSKADLILTLGNRLAFPINSPSFRPILDHSTTIRIDVDSAEFLREIPNSTNYHTNLSQLLPDLLKRDTAYQNPQDWLSICSKLKRALWQWDRIPVVDMLMLIMKSASKEAIFVSDVGNHSFWVSNAYAYSGARNRLLYSGSFGTLGSALPRAIGAYYGAKHPVLCFTGDQGFQMNVQELQFISQHQLPIIIVVLNNHASGMIRNRQLKRPHFLHTTHLSGYETLSLAQIAMAYQLEYRCLSLPHLARQDEIIPSTAPCLIEVVLSEDTPLCPDLPVGNLAHDMEPALPESLYCELNLL